MITNYEMNNIKEMSKKERELMILRNKIKKEEEEIEKKKQDFEPTIEWYSPPLIKIAPEFTLKKGTESKYAIYETQRENQILAVQYFDNKIPESPEEPPKENDYDDSTIKIIPFEVILKNSIIYLKNI